MEFQDKCPNCGHPRQEGASFCSNCGKPFEEPKSETTSPEMPPEETSSPPAPETKYTAWEDRENRGFFGGLWETWKESVFYPDRFFSRVPFSGGIGSPLLYALIVVWIGVAVEQVWGVLFTGFWMDMFTGYIPMEEYMWTTGLQTGFSILYIIIVAPLMIFGGLFILSGVYHLILMIFGWASRDFEATFRTIAYASGPLLFMAVPFCGGTVGWIWSLVLAIIGMKHMQTNNGGRGALVILLPLIICCCLTILLALVFGVALTGFIKEMMESGYSY